jgi:hypothetical protein
MGQRGAHQWGPVCTLKGRTLLEADQGKSGKVTFAVARAGTG